MALTEEQLLDLQAVLEDVSAHWDTLKKSGEDEQEQQEEIPAEEAPMEAATEEAPAEPAPYEAEGEAQPEEAPQGDEGEAPEGEMGQMEDEGYEPAEIYAAMDEDELAAHWEAIKHVISERWAAEGQAGEGEMQPEAEGEAPPMEEAPAAPEMEEQAEPAFKSEDKEKETLKKSLAVSQDSLKKSEESLALIFSALAKRMPARKSVASAHEVSADLKKSETTYTVKERAKKLATTQQLTKSEQTAIGALLTGDMSVEPEVLKILNSKQA